MLRALWITLGVAALAAAPLRAQNPCGASNKVQTDSLDAETRRRSATTGALLAVRRAVVRRLITRIDSLDATCPKVKPDTVFLPAPLPDTVAARVAVSFGPIVTVSWPNGKIGSLPNATGSILCAWIDDDGVTYLGDKAIVASVAASDSIAFTLATVSTEAGLRRECGRVLAGFPADTAPLRPVSWEYARVLFADHLVAVPIARSP